MPFLSYPADPIELFEAKLYCVKCRTQKIDRVAQKTTMKNGKPAIKGKCPDCGTGMYKIGSLENESRLLTNKLFMDALEAIL